MGAIQFSINGVLPVLHFIINKRLISQLTLFVGGETGSGSVVTLGTKNAVSMSGSDGNSTNCSQPVDSSTGFVYQKAACNNKNGILLKIALCDPNHLGFEVYIGTDDIKPTAEKYIHKALLTEKDRDGSFSLLLSNDDFIMPVKDLQAQCTVGVRPIHSKLSFFLEDTGTTFRNRGLIPKEYVSLLIGL